jgi:hypothetical protein
MRSRPSPIRVCRTCVAALSRNGSYKGTIASARGYDRRALRSYPRSNYPPFPAPTFRTGVDCPIAPSNDMLRHDLIGAA